MSITAVRTIRTINGSLWMQFAPGTKTKPDGRARLVATMEARGISQRALSEAVGWKSHTFLGRLIMGKANSLDPKSAVMIAYVLDVPVSELFVPKASTDTAQKTNRRTATSRKAA